MLFTSTVQLMRQCVTLHIQIISSRGRKYIKHYLGSNPGHFSPVSVTLPTQPACLKRVGSDFHILTQASD